MTSVVARKHFVLSQHALVAVLTVCMASVLVALVYRAAFPTPFQDELVFESLYRSLAEQRWPPLPELIAAHNGHPYLVVKALISLTLLAQLPWTWLMYAQICVLASCMLLVVGSRASRLGAVSIVVLAAVLLSPRQWENLYWAMQLAFPLSLLFSLAAFAAADRYARSTWDTRWAYAALASGFAASVSNGAGVFALGLTCVAVMMVGRPARVRSAALVVLALGVLLFVYAQVLAPRSGVGSAPIEMVRALEHAVRMLAHQFIDAPPRSPGTVALGVVTSLVVAYAVARAMETWRECLFELLCIALSLLLIAGVTYSRITAGIFQPDAPRYLPLLAPLTIGTVLLLDRFGRQGVLVGVLGLVAVGYLLALRSEWRIVLYRQQNMVAAHQELCVSGRVHPAHNMKDQLRGSALSDVRTLFCGPLVIGIRQIDHKNISRSAASGFYPEELQTWASPRLTVLLPTEPRPTRVEVSGWLPDTDSYEGARFVIEVLSQDAVLGRLATERPGDFSFAASLPASVKSLEVRASARRPVAGDNRELSWILVSIAFQ